MSHCETCGQEKPPTDDEILAARVDCYRTAYHMLKDLNGASPPEWQVLRTARYLASDTPDMADGMVPETADTDE